jgi:hypothetical protein
VIKSLSMIIIPCYRLQVQHFHEKFIHQDKFDHNCPQTIQPFFKFMKQNKNHGTLNQQPQPHTFVNILFWN